MSDPLIRAAALATHLDDPRWRLIDCRFDLTDPAAGRRAYAQAHLPGARYADLDTDLSSPITAGSGRHPLPDPAVFAARMAAWGIADETEVVVYDHGNALFASRLWWLLRARGHRRVRVLDGGLQAWVAAGLPLTDAPPVAVAPVAVETRPFVGWLSSADVERALADDAIRLVDARAADRFAGQNETLDPVAGHVPGAVNHPLAANLAADGSFLPADELRRRWRATLEGRAPTDLVTMCGSGVTACHSLLALERAGLTGGRLYAGSWSEWIRDPSRPVARG
ncbi:sulfurtransferase [Solimonas marina]|uniref:Sulfurtransferase n=1 Tax=Solimonas marina TaxID=2714601 RepID=A0A969W9G1_9GAMM|nr:sulfurtransferase [Solimonas marina]NKF22438.1 sulfurtransferase [Solimonas marina]